MYLLSDGRNTIINIMWSYPDIDPSADLIRTVTMTSMQNKSNVIINKTVYTNFSYVLLLLGMVYTLLIFVDWRKKSEHVLYFFLYILNFHFSSNRLFRVYHCYGLASVIVCRATCVVQQYDDSHNLGAKSVKFVYFIKKMFFSTHEHGLDTLSWM